MYIYEIFKRDYNELQTLSTDILLGKTDNIGAVHY